MAARRRAPKKSADIHVVLVEDDKDNRDMYADYLRRLGMVVEEARTGLEGFDRAVELQPDIIVTDLHMVGFDGWRLIRHMRADRRTRNIPILAVTATNDEGVEAAFAVGCTALCRKPCSPKDLATEIERVLKLARRQLAGRSRSRRSQ
jgi:CheY-like chemotaxis protein